MRRGGQAGRLALTAVLTALSLIFLYASTLLPTGRMGVVAVAGLFPAAAVVSGGLGAGALCYGGSALLALLLLADKGNALLFLLFFGLYPLVKALVERLRRLPLEFLCKLAFFNGALTLFWFGLRAVFLAALPLPIKAGWLVYLAGNLVFLIYDFGLSKLIAFYMRRIDKVIRKNRA